jgi:hypothetical protein
VFTSIVKQKPTLGGNTNFNQKNIDEAQISDSMFLQLETFMLKDAIAITSLSRFAAREYLEKKGFKMVGSNNQDEAIMDEYVILEGAEQAQVLATSVVSYGEPKMTKILFVLLNPRFESLAKQYMKNALDSEDARIGEYSQKSKLYFLGIHRIDSSKVLKITFREDILPKEKFFSLNYAISEE